MSNVDTPTLLLPFTDGEDTESVFFVIELDSQENTDSQGNELSQFIDSETPFILVHVEPGAVIADVLTSEGYIINPNERKIVRRSHTISKARFKNKGDSVSLSHYPVGGITMGWYGREKPSISLSGREVTANGVGVGDLTYYYEAYQFALRVGDLGVQVGEEFPVEVSFGFSKSMA